LCRPFLDYGTLSEEILEQGPDLFPFPQTAYYMLNNFLTDNISERLARVTASIKNHFNYTNRFKNVLI